MQAGARRPPPRRRPPASIVIDVDFFKRFNDLYGHLTGDQVLRLVAIVMREHVKGRATLARFGGEEFGMLLPDTDRAAAVAIAETVRTSVMGRELVKRSTGESLGKVTISLGVATARTGETPVSLLSAPTCACSWPSATAVTGRSTTAARRIRWTFRRSPKNIVEVDRSGNLREIRQIY